MIAVKSPPRETGTVLPVAPRQATASDYRQLLRDARKLQLRETSDNLQRLAQTYDRAAKAIIERVAALPDDMRGTPWVQAQLQLLRSIDEELTHFRNDYGALLDLSMLSTAQQAANRERDIEKLVNVARSDQSLVPNLSRSVTLSDGLTVSTSFGTLARDAVETAASRYYRDGLQLSDRIHNLDIATRKTVEDTIVQGIADGSSARDLAKNLEKVMTEAGAQTPRYNAMRIARTEVNNTQREASVRATVDSSGNLKSYISGVRWNLSSSHPRADVCDLWAGGGSTGLDAGVYLPNDVPIDHPHGLCYVTSELVDFPGIGGPGKQPDVAGVPESQVRYYAETLNDPVAQAALAARNNP